MTFTKDSATDAVNKVREQLALLGVAEKMQFRITNGKYTDDTLTFKVTVKLLNEDGKEVVGDSSNNRADSFAAEHGISYSTPHFIGSIWRASGKLARVIDINPRNRKYPIIIMKEGVRRKATAAFFTDHVKQPTAEEFHIWYTIDPDDDAVTRFQERTCDEVTEYMNAAFEGDTFDTFMDECERHYTSGLAERYWPYIYKMLFTDYKPLQEVASYQRLTRLS